MAGTGGDSIIEPLNRHAQFRSLASEQRRALLLFLLEEYPSSVSLGTAVAHVAATTNRSHEPTELELRHKHLPVLEDAGLVTHDSADDQLAYCGGAFVRKVLELL